MDDTTTSAGRQLSLFDTSVMEPEGRSPSAKGGLPPLEPIFSDLNERFFGGRLEARLEWSERLTASAGNCRPEERLIRISAPYHRRAPGSLTVTLAHEMCHLVAPGHGAAFRRLARPLARLLGVSWDEFRYADQWADLLRHAYVYRCPGCGAEVATRKRLVRVSCGHCGPGGYDERYHLACVESRVRPGPVLLGRRPVHRS